MSRASIIAPSLLSADFARLGEDCLRAEAAGADWHHVDVMDGHFVPNLTIGPSVVRALARVLTLPLDVHLMITDPWTYGPKFLEAGAAGIGFHAELLVDDRAESSARTLLAEVQRQGARRCIAINPATDVDVVRPWLGDLDMVLVM
ncbi:MAG: ribulose-phosphate 3-epimerase, partial [Planctomycetes bacterium]|nr:ribulose-phosphate 3-epimerase [Planctomycetota bacterium]